MATAISMKIRKQKNLPERDKRDQWIGVNNWPNASCQEIQTKIYKEHVFRWQSFINCRQAMHFFEASSISVKRFIFKRVRLKVWGKSQIHRIDISQLSMRNLSGKEKRNYLKCKIIDELQIIWTYQCYLDTESEKKLWTG